MGSPSEVIRVGGGGGGLRRPRRAATTSCLSPRGTKMAAPQTVAGARVVRGSVRSRQISERVPNPRVREISPVRFGNSPGVIRARKEPRRVSRDRPVIGLPTLAGRAGTMRCLGRFPTRAWFRDRSPDRSLGGRGAHAVRLVVRDRCARAKQRNCLSKNRFSRLTPFVSGNQGCGSSGRSGEGYDTHTLSSNKRKTRHRGLFFNDQEIGPGQAQKTGTIGEGTQILDRMKRRNRSRRSWRALGPRDQGLSSASGSGERKGSGAGPGTGFGEGRGERVRNRNYELECLESEAR